VIQNGTKRSINNDPRGKKFKSNAQRKLYQAIKQIENKAICFFIAKKVKHSLKMSMI